MPDKKNQTKRTRREFLKDAAVLGGTVASGGVLTAVPSTAVHPKPEIIVKEVQVQLQKAIGHVERNLQTCAGCRTCEAVCALSHDGVVSPSLARTWIIDHIAEGRRIEGYTCQQCNSPNCLQSCPLQAISVDPKTGARVIDLNKCQGLQLCIKACPQYPNSPIKFDATRKKAVKCDLCGGDPLCVKYCPEGAITLVKGV
jgi:carbon-monoxide dehydrogenase iron sulfur subunit